MLLSFYQIFIFLLGHLHFFLYFFSTFMENLWRNTLYFTIFGYVTYVFVPFSQKPALSLLCKKCKSSKQYLEWKRDFHDVMSSVKTCQKLVTFSRLFLDFPSYCLTDNARSISTRTHVLAITKSKGKRSGRDWLIIRCANWVYEVCLIKSIIALFCLVFFFACLAHSPCKKSFSPKWLFSKMTSLSALTLTFVYSCSVIR